jgi:hypothetical protein
MELWELCWAVTIPVALRQGCTRESCGEEGEEVVERRCREGGDGEEEGLERRRLCRGEVGQKGGEVVVSGLERLVDLGRGLFGLLSLRRSGRGPGQRYPGLDDQPACLPEEYPGSAVLYLLACYSISVS